ncbi:hypothetical protein [Corynebacterium kalidii]
MPPDNSPPAPTVVRHPWRATLRTVLVAAAGLLPLIPDIARAAHIEAVPAVAAVLVIVAAIQRVLAVPGVEAWLRRHVLRWLAAEPDPTTTGRHRKDAP